MSIVYFFDSILLKLFVFNGRKEEGIQESRK
jgi:hypothetical protein